MLPLSRLAVHTMTHKSWTLAQCCEAYAKAGLGGISVWRNVIEPVGVQEASRIVKASGLKVPALVRGGFFASADISKRKAAIGENLRCLDEAAAIGAEMVVLVAGAEVGLPLEEARKQIADGIGQTLDHASKLNVKLAIEPLHPMYAADRCAINRIREAIDVCEQLKHPLVGVAVDVYHVWWDPQLYQAIEILGKTNRLFALHVCDWRVPTRDLLNDRALMGQGAIDIPCIRKACETASFTGQIEVEIFSTELWQRDPHEYLKDITYAYQRYC
jgi:sugar phosphate isomerase/epimerase